MARTSGLDEKGLAIASATITFLLDAFGYVWHGMMSQPSMMNSLYPGFWSNWTLMIYGLVGTVVGAFIAGYLFALVYNKFS